MASVSEIAGAAKGVLIKNFRQYYMRRRLDWNALGPPLPLWFKAAVKRVDKRLVLQFIPPRSIDPQGVPSGMFPWGVWYICGRIPRCPDWITKRAIFTLADDSGVPVPPTWDIIKVLREAKWDRRREGTSRLEEAFEESVEALGRAEDEKVRNEVMQIVIGNMRKLKSTKSAGARVCTS